MKQIYHKDCGGAIERRAEHSLYKTAPLMMTADGFWIDPDLTRKELDRVEPRSVWYECGFCGSVWDEAELSESKLHDEWTTEPEGGEI
jgi:hypothetical protein